MHLLCDVLTVLLPLKNMTVANGLAVPFAAEVDLQKGEGCSFDLARWLESLSITHHWDHWCIFLWKMNWSLALKISLC